jgi:pantoate--beta-alanine ligase
MGALHEGHLSLLRAARERSGFVAMTLFVNPLQFGEAADLEAYPRDLDSDLRLAEQAGADAVFAPSASEMYPLGPPETRIVPGRLAAVLEGASRPGHFEGVAIVVTKLFAISGTSTAFFGEKDYQQLAVVRRLVRDLDLPIAVVGCPIVRDTDGVALSSRNLRLSPEERRAAAALPRALDAGRRVLQGGGTPAEAEASMAAALAAEPLLRPDYAVVVDAETFEPPGASPDESSPSGSQAPLRLLVAARVGPVRLIDNMAVDAAQEAGANAVFAESTADSVVS